MVSSTRLLAAIAMSQFAGAATTVDSTQANALKDDDFVHYIIVILGGLVVTLGIWRMGIELTKYIRQLTCLNNDTQRYFTKPSETYAMFKKHILYAPIFRKRHNREFQLSSAINVGTLPTRIQLMFLVGYFGTNIAFCVISIQWSGTYIDVTEELRDRTGTLALINMVPLFIMSSRNNPLIHWLNLSFDSFNLLHRWFGRVVILQAITHSAAYTASTVHSGGWGGVMKALHHSEFILMGVVCTFVLIAISIQSISILRHAFYETFKYLHIGLATTVLITLWFHLKLVKRSETKILIVIFVIWVSERMWRVINNLYRNGTGSQALVESLPGNACRVTIKMTRPWTFKAGQHAYLYMPTIALVQSHPFSVAWSEEVESLVSEKLAMNRQDILAMKRTSVSFIIRERTGFTRTLLRMAEASPNGNFTTRVFVEGPFGGMHQMTSYGTVMLFAGGVGITHQVPHVRSLVAGYANGSVAARKVILVWIIQSPEHLEWIRPWMTSILAMDKRRDVLKIMLFISRPRSTKEIHSPSATVQMFPGRPNINTLIDLEIEGQIGAMGVSVCGSGPLSDDVRRAVRDRQMKSNIDFVEEAFSW